jgi:hypothetical protein
MHKDRIDDVDAQSQAAILALVLAEFPTQFSRAELALQVLGGDPEFRDRDRYERALDDLVRAGLIRDNGALIIATRAACYFDALPLP